MQNNTGSYADAVFGRTMDQVMSKMDQISRAANHSKPAISALDQVAKDLLGYHALR